MDARAITVLRARDLRRRMTLPEVLLWRALRNRGKGLKFRRQHPIGPFILDFYCSEAQLAMEIDGAFHHSDAAESYDDRRDAWLHRKGIEVLRFPARWVLNSPEGVVGQILAAANKRIEALRAEQP
jgi:very-short-patch-repair endonuclease